MLRKTEPRPPRIRSTPSRRAGASASSAGDPEPLGALLPRIEVSRPSELLAEQLRRRILDGAFPEGGALPVERDLAERSGLSRGTVREALKALEVEGLIQTRPGRYGGSIVCRPTDATLARHVGAFVRGRGVSVQAVIEARTALQPSIAELAAIHRGDDDLDRLRAVSAVLEAAEAADVPAFLQANVDWNCALAAATRNDLLRAFMVSLSGPILEVSRIGDFASDDVRALVVRAHRRIFDAVLARDPAAARRRMERHIQAYSEQARQAVARAQAAAAGARPGGTGSGARSGTRSGAGRGTGSGAPNRARSGASRG